MMISLMVPTILVEAKHIPDVLIKMIKDGPLSLDRGPRKNSKSYRLCFIEERGKAEGQTVSAIRGRRGPMLVRSMK